MRFQALVALIVFAVLVVLLSSLATLAAFVSADMVEYVLGSQFAGIDREFNWLERRCAHMQCFVEISTGGGDSDPATCTPMRRVWLALALLGQMSSSL